MSQLCPLFLIFILLLGFVCGLCMQYFYIVFWVEVAVHHDDGFLNLAQKWGTFLGGGRSLSVSDWRVFLYTSGWHCLTVTLYRALHKIAYLSLHILLWLPAFMIISCCTVTNQPFQFALCHDQLVLSIHISKKAHIYPILEITN